jgi:hypothetical protein
MTDENGNLSIDFLAGFTIFMLAFIWVVSMIPGLMIGLQSYTIDYDAVAYRTGVILVEDPGWPFSPPWESFNDAQKFNVTRFGLAVSKDTPNILSEDKVNRFFCATAFIYPDDYRSRVIFGDYPYGFNISLIDDGGKIKSVGDVLPNGYGYIRRPVKIKGASNATINHSYIQSHSFTKADNATTHVFSILIDNPKLLGDITDPVYQIDPAREQITINITNLSSIDPNITTIKLDWVRVYKRDGSGYSPVPVLSSDFPYIDGSSTRVSAMPADVTDNVTLKFSPQFFYSMKMPTPKIYIALGFEVDPPGKFLNNTQAMPDFFSLNGTATFNSPNVTPFYYDYNPLNVTQPHLRDAVVEVAVWSSAVTSYGGGGATPTNGTHTIYAYAGSGGTISPSGIVIVSDGANQLFTITNSTGYHTTDVVIDGVSNGSVSSYTFTNVSQDHTIAASFAINTYVITPTTPLVNGTINPNTPQTVNYGGTPTFTFTPSPGYHVDTVFVNGTPLSPTTPTTYTFPAVTSNQTISATFAPVFFDNFDAVTSPAGWTILGIVDRYTGSPHDGVAGIRQRDIPSSMVRTISTTGYSAITVSFDMGSKVNTAGMYMKAEWSPDGGTTWNLLKQINYGDPEDDDNLYPFSYSLPASADNNANFSLRFVLNANVPGEKGYVENVLIGGNPI